MRINCDSVEIVMLYADNRIEIIIYVETEKEPELLINQGSTETK